MYRKVTFYRVINGEKRIEAIFVDVPFPWSDEWPVTIYPPSVTKIPDIQYDIEVVEE